MATTSKTLTDKVIKSAKPKDKDYKIQDGRGLFILVAKTGGKRWRLRYVFNGKQKDLALGLYPEVSLATARQMREMYKEQIANNIDPALERKLQKETLKQEAQEQDNQTRFTFKKLSTALLDERLHKEEISDTHYKRTINALKNDAFPLIGNKAVKEITTNDVKSIVTKVAERGADDSARKLYYSISKIFKVLVTRDNANNDDTNYQITNPPAQIDLKDLIGEQIKKHYPTITDDKGIRGLLLSIDDYTGDFTTVQALKMLPYVFVRPTNIRHAEWSEINIVDKQWIIPAKKMKTKAELIIPLTDTVIKILEDVRPLTGDGKYIFPSIRSSTTPMSDNTLVSAFRRMGYTKEQFVPHGFRAMFSTIAHEKSEFKHEVIEIQLSHSVGSSVSKAYNRAKYLDERVELMQWWSDYLDGVKNAN